MSEEQITHEINLVGGYTANGVTHRRVVFGKRMTAKRLLALRLDKTAEIATQFQDLQIVDAIVEFGSLKMPIPMTTLLALNTIDRDDLRAGLEAFNEKYVAGREYKFSDDKKKVTLVFGLKIGELRYTVIEFGKDLNGYDEVAADKAGASDVLARKAFLAGRMVTKISTAQGVSLDGPIEFETINSDDVDEDDLFAFISASELWRQSFRLRGGNIQAVGRGADGPAAGDEKQLERGSDSANAVGAA